MPRPKSTSPTLDDVALRANVSSATVSRYFNHPDRVSAATQAAICSAIEEVGYVPNLMAGGLATSRSKMVAVLIPHLGESLFNSTIEAMVDQLSVAGSIVMLALTGGSAKRTDDMINAAIARRVDAIVSTAPVSAVTRKMIERFPGIYIQVWDLPEDPLGVAIGFSHMEAGRALAKFVKSRGYQRPMVVSAELGRAGQRRDGFVNEWQAGGGGDVLEAFVDVPSRFGHARRVFAQIRRYPEPPDCVICGSDFLAQGIIVEANAAGIKVPDQLAVVGFGNSHVASDMRPTVTTVDIDGAKIARHIIDVINEYEDRRANAARVIDVGFQLIVRESA